MGRRADELPEFTAQGHRVAFGHLHRIHPDHCRMAYTPAQQAITMIHTMIHTMIILHYNQILRFSEPTG